MYFNFLSSKINFFLVYYQIFSSKKSLNWFKYSLIKKNLKNSKLKVFKLKKYLITTLRAPKHFKIGRNHFQQNCRRMCIRLPFNFSTPYSVLIQPIFIKKLLLNLFFLAPSHPITKISFLSADVSFFFSINIK